MRGLKRLLARVKKLVMASRGDARLREELETHASLLTEENICSGMTPEEARRQAVLKLGAIEAVREQYHSEEGLPFLQNVVFDLRYAVRMILRFPGFSFIAIATMALGIGATTAIYSVIDATLLHPLPYPNPGELIHVEDDLTGIGAEDVGTSVPEWRDLKSSGIFQSVAIAGHGADVNLTGGSRPERLGFKAVTTNYFTVLGVSAQLGRTFDPLDSTPGYNLEVVLSDGLWRREFGADPLIIGKTLRLDNDDYHVVGVMPRGFRDQGSSSNEQSVDIWLGAGYSGIPFPPPQRALRMRRAVIARLNTGISIQVAQQHIDAMVEALKRQYPAEYPPEAGWAVRLIPLSKSVLGNSGRSLVLLFGAVGLLLLIGCVNVANLLLARASARSREMAVRQALGAQRARLIRQLIIETLLLFVIGGIAGFGILFCTQQLLVRLIPDGLPHISAITVGWGVLGFAIAVSIGAGTVFGIAPALQTSRVDLMGTLRREGRGSSGSLGRSRARQVLVVSELALAVVLMIAAGLLLRSFWGLFKVQPGFNPNHAMAIQTWLPGPNDPNMDVYRTPTQESVLVREILRRAWTLHGMQEVAVGDLSSLPLGHGSGALNPMPMLREGLETRESQAPLINNSIVSPEYFRLLRMPLLRGRVFNNADLENTLRVAVINQAAARTFWPNQDPIGKRVHLLPQSNGSRELFMDAPLPWTTIIGVIADARVESLSNEVAPHIYSSIYQRPSKGIVIYLRGELDPSSVPTQLSREVQSIDPNLPVFHPQTLDEVLTDSLSIRRFSMEMVGAFAATALLLASLGIYGTISYVVNEQRREIAIRLALGAQRDQILKMVLDWGFRLAAVGVLLGVAGAFIVSHLMAGLLFGVSPTDLPTFVSVTTVLVIVALAASAIPALRAMRVNPLATLHSE